MAKNAEMVNTENTMKSFVAAMQTEGMSFFGMASQEAGATDSTLHIGTQLMTDDIVSRNLTVTACGFASVPVYDDNNEPVYQSGPNGEIVVDDDGCPIQARSEYPVFRFKEYPEAYYNGGTMAAKNVIAWAKACGDDISNPTLPLTNAKIEEVGGIPVRFEWREKRRGASGQRYLAMMVR